MDLVRDLLPGAMRKLILLLGLLLFVARPASAAFTFIQSKCTGTTTTDACVTVLTCTLSGLASVGAGHLVVVTLIKDSSNNSLISSITNETVTHCPTCNKQTASHGNDASYIFSSVGGWTSTQITISISNSFNFCVSEYSSNTGSIALDNGASSGACNSDVTSAAPVSCALTTSGANLLIVTTIGWGGSVTGVNAPYANFIEPNGDGISNNLNITAGTGCVWTPTTVNTGTTMSIAFKDAAAGGAAPPTLNLLGVGK